MPLEQGDSSSAKPSSLIVAPIIPDGIILANPHKLAALVEPLVHNDPLKALEDDLMTADGAATSKDSDIFKALPLIEDVEMSSESTKRKRKVEGEAAM